MVAINPGSKENVDKFYHRALELGAICEGEPGQRIPDMFYGATSATRTATSSAFSSLVDLRRYRQYTFIPEITGLPNPAEPSGCDFMKTDTCPVLAVANGVCPGGMQRNGNRKTRCRASAEIMPGCCRATCP